MWKFHRYLRDLNLEQSIRHYGIPRRFPHNGDFATRQASTKLRKSIGLNLPHKHLDCNQNGCRWLRNNITFCFTGVVSVNFLSIELFLQFTQSIWEADTPWFYEISRDLRCFQFLASRLAATSARIFAVVERMTVKVSPLSVYYRAFYHGFSFTRSFLNVRPGNFLIINKMIGLFYRVYTTLHTVVYSHVHRVVHYSVSR